ncbi:response regulator transcription factor [Arthrobacter tecti]
MQAADDAVSGELLSVGIELKHYPDGPSALLAIGVERPQVVLASTEMTGINVVDFTGVVAGAAGIPVLVGVLSSYKSQVDAFHALERGARGMTPLPISTQSLAASVSQLGMLEHADATEIQCGGLTLSAQSLRVFVHGTAVHLAPKEFGVLRYLMSEAPRVVSVEEVAGAIGNDQDRDFTRTRMAIMRTRKKLMEAAADDAVFIETVRGLGYRMNC